MNRYILGILVLIFSTLSISAKDYKNDFLSVLNNKVASIGSNNNKYCFKVSNKSIKVVKNIANCNSVNNINITEKGLLCVEGDSIDCRRLRKSNSGYSWGRGKSPVTTYDSIDDLFDSSPNTKNTTDFNEKPVVANKNTDTVAQSSVNETNDIVDKEYWGKKYFERAERYFNKKDYEKAYKWAKKAADVDYGGGYFGLGLAYEKGFGVVEKDKDEAIKWYKKAVEKGYNKANRKLGLLTGKIKPEKTVLSCNGKIFNFIFRQSSYSTADEYWEDVTISENIMIAPNFANYEYKGKKGSKRFWLIEGGTKDDGWATYDSDTGKFTATKKKIQLQGSCKKKTSNWN